ncbi:MAG: hypothetical protein WAU69_13305, partial [Solirubrobacteraceae bacterium]
MPSAKQSRRKHNGGQHERNGAQRDADLPASGDAMSSRAVNRPHGAVRHYASLLGPNMAAVAPAMLERDVGRRLSRLSATSSDRVRQRLRSSRPRMRALQAA